MTQQSKKIEPAAQANEKTKLKSDNLHKIQDASKDNQVLEINKQMTSLESSIEQLKKQLNTTNKQIKTDVTRLTQSDDDITDKVAETYRQLGQIETTFQDLGKQSKKINADIKKVTSSIKTFEKTSSDALNQAIENQSEINIDFKQQHESIITRADKLSKQAESITRKLNKSIKDNSKEITELEARIISELEKQAQLSQDRDGSLDDKIQKADKEIGSQKAKMLLMQSVDEALNKRAVTLELTSEKLLSDTEELIRSTEVLNILTGKLSDDVEALEIHTARLDAQNLEQQGFINSLQTKTDSMARTLLALVSLETKHFRMLASFSLLILLAVIAVFFYGEYQRDTQLSETALRSSQVDEQVSKLQNRLEDEQMASQVFYSEITDLQKNIGQLQQKLDGVNSQVVVLNDQVESIDGRIQYIAPLYNFGTDNTIHGSEWLSKLDSKLHSIKVTTVTDKQELYRTASRYNYYLKKDLAYFINQDGSFTLIEGGRYQSEELVKVLRDMPSYINHEPVTTISNELVLKQIQKI